MDMSLAHVDSDILPAVFLSGGLPRHADQLVELVRDYLGHLVFGRRRANRYRHCDGAAPSWPGHDAKKGSATIPLRHLADIVYTSCRLVHLDFDDKPFFPLSDLVPLAINALHRVRENGSPLCDVRRLTENAQNSFGRLVCFDESSNRLVRHPPELHPLRLDACVANTVQKLHLVKELVAPGGPGMRSILRSNR